MSKRVFASSGRRETMKSSRGYKGYWVAGQPQAVAAGTLVQVG